MSRPSLMMTANPAMSATIAGKDNLDSGANDLPVMGARQVNHHIFLSLFLKQPVELQITKTKAIAVLPPTTKQSD